MSMREVGMEQQQVIGWIREHAPLADLCEHGGWPDAARLNIEVRSRSDREWIVDIDFTESTMEISECDIREAIHGGKFAVALDAEGNPVGIRLLERLWSQGDTEL